MKENYTVHGVELIPGAPGCAHWRSDKDIVALKFKCCGVFYACYECHKAGAGHAVLRWPKSSWKTEKAVLCRACDTAMTIDAYMKSNAMCPACNASFNPNCSRHWPLYFELP